MQAVELLKESAGEGVDGEKGEGKDVDVDVDVDTLGEVKDSQEDDAYLEKKINNLKEQHEKELLSMKEGRGNCAQEEIVKELKAEIERLTNELKLKQQQQPEQLLVPSLSATSDVSTSSWEWYYLDKDEQNIGPFDIEQLKEHFQEGIIGLETFMWAEELSGGWCELRKINELLVVKDCSSLKKKSRKKSRKKSVVKIANISEAKKLLMPSRSRYHRKHASMECIAQGNTHNLAGMWGK
jgi:hypothetical protein